MSGGAGITRHQVLDTGISVVYDSQDPSPIVDIVIVHGLHGHPYKSWTAKALPTQLASPTSSTLPSNAAKHEPRYSWRHAIRRASSLLSKRATAVPTKSVAGDDASIPVFWPADLLPEKCPHSRVLTFGYDSKITKYIAGATNKGSLLAHSRDFLFSLCRDRVRHRPIIFVAHSLGGIIVKEMLARSDAATDPDMKDIIESTAAVVFLGTPHRGSPDLAAMGEYLRSIVSGLRMETTSAILDALGLKTTDLERAQEAFSRLWQEYDFRVKTFQEGLGLSGVNLGVLTNKVVPDYSSSIGDHRERCETLQANHKEMCRFTGHGDPNCHKVFGELRSIYLSLCELHVRGLQHAGRNHHYTVKNGLASSMKSLEPGKRPGLSDIEKASLESLWFPGMSLRLRRVKKAAEHTCSWLFNHRLYQDWFSGRNRDRSQGLLWVRGKPGTGKSTLMKEAYTLAVRGQADADYCAAAFFFSAKDGDLEHSATGLLRSLLYQLLPSCPESLTAFGNAATIRRKFEPRSPPWEEEELKSVFRLCFTKKLAKRVFIYIDALDECDSDRLRDQAYFWREVTATAHDNGISLNICISSRHFPHISLSHCPEIVVEDHNNLDIETYVGKRLELCIDTEEPLWKLLKDRICSKSAGVFLWAVLVLDDILLDWDGGKDIRHLLTHVDILPEHLETLFSEILSTVRIQDRQLTTRFFQWVIMAAKPLRVHEWHHILAFIRQPVPASLAEWRASNHFTKTDDQLERQIRSISKGLVEIRSTVPDETLESAFDALSIRAGAGSLDFELGETRAVQVVHGSVRDFFLYGAGFAILDGALHHHPIGEGHLSIMATCLDYLDINELDALVAARKHAITAHRRTVFSCRPRPESSSNSTSASNDVSQNKAFEDHGGPALEQSSAFPAHGTKGPISSDTGVSHAVSYDMLKRHFATEQGIDIDMWMGRDDDCPSLKLMCESGSPSTAPTQASGRVQLLEDYPALLSYAAYEFFTHACRAQDDNVSPKYIIPRLTGNAWGRLVALREDIPEGLTLFEYAFWFHHLESWLEVLNPDLNNISPEPVIYMHKGRTKDPNPYSPVAHVPRRPAPTQSPLRGPDSVASFGSASSHTGSVVLKYAGKLSEQPPEDTSSDSFESCADDPAQLPMRLPIKRSDELLRIRKS